MQVNPTVLQENDIYETASGHLLLAWLPEKERALVFERHGLPQKSWVEATTEKEMEKELAAIRNEECVVLQHRKYEIIYIAYPIKTNGTVSASVDIYVPIHRYAGKHKRRCMRAWLI